METQKDLEEKFKEQLEIKNYSKRTIKEYIRYLKILMHYDINQDGINQFLKRNNNGISRAFLKSLKNWLKLNYEIPSLKGRKGSKKLKYLTKDEIDKLINEYPNPRYALLVQLLYETGLRISEAISLTPNNVDFNKLCIRGIGKGNVEYEVMISQDTADCLIKMSELLEEGERFWHTTVRTIERSFVNNGLKILDKRVTPHMLRHSTGTELRRKGVPIEVIKDYLRHKQMDTTLIYAQTIDKEKQVQEPVRKALID